MSEARENKFGCWSVFFIICATALFVRTCCPAEEPCERRDATTEPAEEKNR